MAHKQLLRGHTDAVTCLAYSAGTHTLASGAEDGRLLLHQPTTAQPVQSYVLPAKCDAPAALAYHPIKQHLLLAAAGPTLHLLDTRQLSGPPLTTTTLNSDDVGALAINLKGTYVATADDAGDVVVATWMPADTLQPYRRLTAAHEPLAAAVSFRPQRPWELLSGGLDCCCRRWDFSRGRVSSSWSMAEPPARAPAAVAKRPTGASRKSAPQQQQEEEAQQLWNPPWVYCIAVPHVASKGGGAAASAVAIARGDGVVTILDADAAEPSNTSRNSSSSGRSPQDAAETLQSGFRVDLNQGSGGHSKAAAAVEFLRVEGGARLLVSGGEDGYLVLWDWQQAAAPSCDSRPPPAAAAAAATSGASAAAADSPLHQTTAAASTSLSNQQQQQPEVAAMQQLQLQPHTTHQADKQQQQQVDGGLGSYPPACVWRLHHKKKVNALCSVSAEACQFAVCDTSRLVTLYTPGAG